MKKYTIITISRQYGSGGRDIGKLLSEKLNIPFYDREVMILASKKSGIAEIFFEHAEENEAGSILYPISQGSTFDLPLSDKVHLTQCEIINELAEKGPCIMVGCGASEILKDYNTLKVFVYAHMEYRKHRAISEYGVSPKKVSEKILEIDKKHASYYHHYFNKKFGVSDNYDLCIDSGSVGIEKAADIIKEVYLSISNFK